VPQLLLRIDSRMLPISKHVAQLESAQAHLVDYQLPANVGAGKQGRVRVTVY
jgi:hypothetical protein